MRVTSSTVPGFLLNQLGNLETNQSRLQSEVSTGLSVQNPEDNPNAMQSVMDTNANASLLNQYQSNITSLQGVATASSSAMQSLQKIISKASEIATTASGVISPQQMTIDAAQVSQLIQQAVDAANTQYQGNYIFGGTNSGQAAYTTTQDSSGNITGVTYQGNSTLPETEISQGVTVSGQTLGENNSGTGPRGLFADSRFGADLFGHLLSLQKNLASGNSTAISTTDNKSLITDEDNLAYQIGANGAVQSRLQVASTSTTSQLAALKNNSAQQSGADLTQTLLQLNQNQTAYQAALQTGGQILKMSLLNYIQ